MSVLTSKRGCKKTFDVPNKAAFFLGVKFVGNSSTDQVHHHLLAGFPGADPLLCCACAFGGAGETRNKRGLPPSLEAPAVSGQVTTLGCYQRSDMAKNIIRFDLGERVSCKSGVLIAFFWVLCDFKMTQSMLPDVAWLLDRRLVLIASQRPQNMFTFANYLVSPLRSYQPKPY